MQTFAIFEKSAYIIIFEPDEVSKWDKKLQNKRFTNISVNLFPKSYKKHIDDYNLNAYQLNKMRNYFFKNFTLFFKKK